jgi:hypothetical protein
MNYMVIDKVFETLKEYDRTLTKQQFAEQYLGKCESYLYVMKHRQKEVSNDALVRCYVGLKKSADELEKNGITNITYQSNKKLAALVLEQIENKVVDEI